MPAPVSPHRRSREAYENDDSADISSDADYSQLSSGRKRTRLSNGTSFTSPPFDELSTHGHLTPSNFLQRETLRAQTSKKGEHQPGSIVRVKLENFVTYDAVEFSPGPSLNMVIGPNGTGKSTLVCAICLGLGWGPQHLGRAKEVSEFVKHGSQEATIEIELARDGKRFKKNIIIRCTIKRDGNKTVFSIDGKPQSKKHVVQLARSLAIQIDNLCQFLPQDKVVEFAAMTPVQLLHSTERAVASQDMIDMHEELKDLGRKQKDLQTRVNSDQDTLSNLEGRQRLQEADVERMREREVVVKRVDLLQKAKPTVRYRMARVRFQEAKERRKAAHIEFTTKSAEVEPALRAVNAKERYKQRIDAVVKERRATIQRLERAADGIDRQSQTLQDQHTELDTAIATERTASKKCKAEIAKFEGAVRELKIQLQHAPPEFDVAAYNEQLRTKRRTWDFAETQIRNLKGQQQNLVEQGRQRSRDIREAEQNLAQLESQVGRQNAMLQKICSDSAKLWSWVQQNQDKFEKHVFGPPIVECSVKDPRYVDLVESLFQRNLFLSFTVQTKNDATTISDIAHDLLKLSEVNFKTSLYPLDHFRSPVSEEDMRRYGFEGWALEYISGPDPVLAMLCGEIKMHETGMAISDTTSQQFQMLQNSSISSWVTKKTSYRISRRREYGPSATSTQTRHVKKASVWTDQPVDPSAKRQLQDRMNNLVEELDEFKRKVQDLKSSEEEQIAIYRTAKTEEKNLAEEKKAKQEARAEFSGIPNRIATNEAKLQAKRDLLSGTFRTQREHAEKQDAVAMDRAKVAVKYAEAIESLLKAHNSLYEVEIVFIEAKSDFETLDQRSRSIKEELDTKQRELKELERESDDAKDMAQRMLSDVKNLLAHDENNTLRDFLQTLSTDQTIEELESEIESEKARLELMHEGNGNTIREFEQRRKKIDALSAKLDETKAALADLDRGVNELRSQWEPELDHLVGKISASFSYNMEQISCAGEVGIWKDEDFEQWTIQIRVKFRENEPLCPLTSHRQSGGERAVSTIFYLMSLQSLTPSPFRVVDEINQGMDPRNERLVHKRMVDIACGVTDNPTISTDSNDNGGEGEDGKQKLGGSQYFLITPKLLHDLEYAKGMRVLCIASGEWMPEDQTKVDFGLSVQRMEGVRAEWMAVRGRSSGGAMDMNGSLGSSMMNRGRRGITAR